MILRFESKEALLHFINEHGFKLLVRSGQNPTNRNVYEKDGKRLSFTACMRRKNGFLAHLSGVVS